MTEKLKNSSEVDKEPYFTAKDEADFAEYANMNPKRKEEREKWAPVVKQLEELGQKNGLTSEPVYKSILQCLKTGQPEAARQATVRDGDKLNRYQEVTDTLDEVLPGEKRWRKIV